jgi:hypothetical protein
MSKLPEYPHFDTQTPELYKRITTVIIAILPVHLLCLVKIELFIDLEDAFVHLRN